MYGGCRHILLHASLVEDISGNSGLVAGCGFAVFFLKAYLMDIDGYVLYCTIRIYVDDITMTVIAANPNAVVRKVSRDLPKIKILLNEKHQDSNDKKEQFYSPNGQVLKLWKQCHPEYRGKITDTAKDLGICQRAVHRKSDVREKRLSLAGPICNRIGALAVEAKRKVSMVKTAVHPKVLYGCEVDQITKKQACDLRKVVAKAIFGFGPKNDTASLLLAGDGMAEPQVYTSARTLINWQRQMTKGIGSNNELKQYWNVCNKDNGKI